MILDRDDGKTLDGLAQRVRRGVEEIVRQQRDAGVDVVNDGEQSKISYATYIRDRLTGFEGEPSALPGGETILRDHPDLAQRFASQVTQTSFVRPRPACNGPIQYRDTSAVQQDIANLQLATSPAGTDQVFMTAASPGVVAMFFENRYYPSQDAYVNAIADAMRQEYEAIAGAGFVLQLDCPDLAAGPSMLNTDQ